MIAYRLLLALFGPPALLLRQGVLALRGRAEKGGLSQRLALSMPDLPGPTLWLHAASNGELASARTPIRAILDRHPNLRILVTTNTVTGRALAEGWALPRLTARLAPVDTPGAVRRFLAAVRPAACIVVENELWPERLTACAAAGVPVLVIGARLSAGSHRNWRRLPGLARKVTGAITWLSAQDEGSARRFAELGLDPARIAPVLDLKAFIEPTATAPVLPYLRATTVLAASTHPGEEAPILDAFRAALAENLTLRLILAPRHARRGAEVERLLAASGLSFARRSRGQAPEPETQVYLADTMGEMDLWYAAAGITIVAGSFSDRGGHTPYEPAAHGSALIHGPDVANFAGVYARLDTAGGAIRVEGAPDLSAAILTLADPENQADVAGRARAALGTANPTALDPFLAALDASLARKVP